MNLLGNSKMTIIKDYIEELKKIQVPGEYEAYSYSDSGRKRDRIHKFYRDEILDNGKNTEEKKEEMLKIKRKKLVTLNKKSCDSMFFEAHICAQLIYSYNQIDGYYLLNQLIAHKMAQDFDDETIEKANLWYNLNFLRPLAKVKIDDLKFCDYRYIYGHALATRAYHEYLLNPEDMSKAITKMVTKKQSLNQLLVQNGITFTEEDFINDLHEQEQILKK